MQQESESREEIDGMQNCYQALLRIYQSKELYKQATLYAAKTDRPHIKIQPE